MPEVVARPVRPPEYRTLEATKFVASFRDLEGRAGPHEAGLGFEALPDLQNPDHLLVHGLLGDGPAEEEPNEARRFEGMQFRSVLG